MSVAWYIPRDLDEAARISRILAASGVVPDTEKPEAICAILMRGGELGLGPMSALAAIRLVKGKPSLAADAMVALVLRSGRAAYFRATETTTERATYETVRRDDPTGTPQSLTFTIEDAKRAGITTAMWARYPAQMLRARASAGLVRMAYPDVCAGLYTPDELGAEVVPAEVEDIDPGAGATPSANRGRAKGDGPAAPPAARAARRWVERVSSAYRIPEAELLPRLRHATAAIVRDRVQRGGGDAAPTEEDVVLASEVVDRALRDEGLTPDVAPASQLDSLVDRMTREGASEAQAWACVLEAIEETTGAPHEDGRLYTGTELRTVGDRALELASEAAADSVDGDEDIPF